ncbi:hypothetical protein H9Q13_15450 [Pontibacter sp. JH31]|uniref:Tetratricopeptide repeat protein n=1 Tax=Pontibacter aquaedesilientis TaxID=2766980 RepID=A0ABR7XJV1_9BACT|nr:hypothetical protein [Pontibacter aquaedesilientis]MBD1398567.1 hypothetical protein [Pontibacter aquaedesilientis]
MQFQFRSRIPQCFLPALLLFFMLSLGAKAQANADYVKAYHPHINQAESLLMAQDYAGALESYRHAFGAVPHGFARDYYNAAICATLTNNEKQAIGYLENLVETGVSLEYLEQQEVFAPLREHKVWKKFVKKYPKRRKEFRKKTNIDLRADLDELWARDQYFRQAKGGLKVHGDTLRKIEADNVKNLLAWISQHGYPGERLIGVPDTLEQLPRFSIVIQRQTAARNGFDFTPVLVQAVHEGKLDPHAAAYLIDQQQGKNLYRSKVLAKVSCDKPKECEEDEELAGMASRYLTHKISQEEEEKVNERRAALGLESIADYRNKMRYALEDRRFKLGYDWAVINYKVPSKEAAKVLTESLVAVE